MKTSELITVLQERVATHGDLPVETTWEGTVHDVDASNVYAARDWRSGALRLQIDADENSYKARGAVDPNEGESDESARIVFWTIRKHERGEIFLQTGAPDAWGPLTSAVRLTREEALEAEKRFQKGPISAGAAAIRNSHLAEGDYG